MKWLARHREVHVVMLVMPDPRVTRHEVNAALDECTALCAIELGNIGGIEDYARNTNVFLLGRAMKGVQVICNGLEVDIEILMTPGGIELQVVAKLVEGTGGKGDRLSL